MKAVVKVDIVDGKCVVIYSDGSEQKLYDVSDDTGGGGEAVLGTKNITSNGSYTARNDGYDGYSKVNVNVPTGSADLGTKNIVTNGTYNASSDNLDGYSSVNVNVPTGITPTGTKQITINSNGTTTEDVTNYANAQITVNVPSSGIALSDFLKRTQPTGDVIFNDGDNLASTLSYNTNITSFESSTINSFKGTGIFEGCTGLKKLKITSVINANLSDKFAYNCSNLETVSLPKISGEISVYSFDGNTKLHTIDLGNTSKINANVFNACSALNKIIIRRNTLCALQNIWAFNNSPFANNRSGGTLYVPSALISEYETASNWSTILGYTNNRIVAIEGSEFENNTADGTPIT